MSGEGGEGGDLAVVDACVLVGRSRYGGELSLPSALAQAAALGVRTLVAAPAAPPNHNFAAATGRLLRAAQDVAEPVRAVALARVDPWQPDAVAAAESALAAGAVGVFLHPWEETFRVTDHPLLDPVMRLLASVGRPVVVESGFPWVSEPAQLADLALRHPGVAVLATRGGHMNMSGLSGQTALRALRSAPNLHVLTSGVYRQDWLRAVIDELGAHRLCYGSLAPVLDPRLELLRPAAVPDPSAREQVLHGTAHRLFGLDTTRT